MGLTPTAAALAFAAVLVLPSTIVIHKFLGVPGLLVYVPAASAALIAIHNRGFAWIVRRLTGRGAAVAAAALVLGLIVAFAIGFPLAQARILGEGSDRNEHLHIGALELVAGRYPYYFIGPEPYDSYISQMPGALLLGIPFALMGNGSYQNFFWLAAFAYATARVYADRRAAIALSAIVLASAPIVLNEFVIGGDLLANSIYVALFALSVVTLVPDERMPGWLKVAASAALGIGLSSRGHFLLILPLVPAALYRRGGGRAALVYTATIAGSFAAVTLPFYFYDPAGFAPLWTAGFLDGEKLPPWTGFAVAAVCGLIAVVCALDGSIGERERLLGYCALVVAVPIIASGLVGAYDTSGVDIQIVSYGLSSVFFGALAFRPPLARGG